MKVKELIRQLQDADPTGDLEACVGNIDIHFVCRDPAYYDGPLQVLKRDPDRKGMYDICAAEFRKDGHKVQIHTLSIKDAIWEDPDLPVECPSGEVEEWRRDAKADECVGAPRENEQMRASLRRVAASLGVYIGGDRDTNTADLADALDAYHDARRWLKE